MLLGLPWWMSFSSAAAIDPAWVVCPRIFSALFACSAREKHSSDPACGNPAPGHTALRLRAKTKRPGIPDTKFMAERETPQLPG